MLLDYYLCSCFSWFKRNEEVEEEDLLYELDILEREFRNYKELRKKKAEIARVGKKKNKEATQKLYMQSQLKTP